jgi:hypothetical protein
VKIRNVVALACLALLVLAPCAPAEEDALFRFAILGDRTGGHVTGVYPEVIKAIDLMHPDLVVTVGDHIEGYGDDYDLAAAEWDTVIGFLRLIDAPVEMTPGNHDIWSAKAETLYVEKTGRKPYYSFDFDGAHFLVIDNSRIESWNQMGVQQWSWILRDLSATEADHIYVFFHKPFWEQTLRRGKPDRLHDIFVDYGVDAVFSGHYHQTFSADYDGIQYTAIGSSGAEMDPSPVDPRLIGRYYHFGWVTVTPDGQDIALVEPGAVHSRDEVTVALLDEVDRITGKLITLSPLRVDAGTSAMGTVKLTIDNPSQAAIDGVATWKTVEGWMVEPTEAAFTAPPGAARDVPFEVTNMGDLYPVPAVSLGYPLTDGRSVTVEKPLPILRRIGAAPSETPPAIDGLLTDPVWSVARAATRLYPGTGYEPVQGGTEFRFGSDGSNLYVSVVNYDDMMSDLAEAATERDGTVYLDDCDGFFLCPDLDAMTVYQIYVNPAGTVFDQKITFDENMWWTADPTWNGDYDVAVVKAADHWTIELAIPLASLAAEAGKDHPWRINFRRKQHRTGGTADWQVPIDYNPNTFGELDFQ